MIAFALAPLEVHPWPSIVVCQRGTTAALSNTGLSILFLCLGAEFEYFEHQLLSMLWLTAVTDAVVGVVYLDDARHFVVVVMDSVDRTYAVAPKDCTANS